MKNIKNLLLLLGIFEYEMSKEPRNNRPRGVEQRAGMGQRRSTSYIEQSRSKDFGEWLYDHLVGICAVVAVFVVSAGALAISRYHVKIVPMEYQIEIVPEQASNQSEQPQPQPDRMQELEERMEQVKVQNLISNDASDSEGSNEGLSSLDAETQALMGKIASDKATNYNEYQSGFRTENGNGSGAEGSGGGSKGKEHGKFSGRVTIAYEFRSPIRHHRNLYEPAYRAEGAGEVVVEVIINRNGDIISARVISSTNSKLDAIALAAARDRKTHFNIDSTAPEQQRGTITYTFIAQ